MRSGKGISRGKHDAGMRNGGPDVDKGFAAPGRRGDRSSSDSDDANVMRQLLSPENRQRVAAAARGRVASRRDVDSDGPASDTDDRASAMSEDEDSRHARLSRSGRAVGTESPVTTPVGSPSQTPVPNSSSSGGRSRDNDKMDVDDVGGDAPRRDGNAPPSQEDAAQVNTPPPIAYVACHTWPPCAVCARITGTSLKHIPSITAQARKRIAQTMPPATDIPPPITGPQDIPRLPIVPPPPANAVSPPTPPLDPTSQFPPQLPIDSASPPFSLSPSNMPRSPNGPNAPPNTYPPRSDYPMEPLFMSALNAPGAHRQTQFKILPPGADGRRTLQNNMLNSMNGGNRPGGFYNRTQPRNAQASSSSMRLEDMDGTLDDGSGMGVGGAPKPRGRGKGRIPGRKPRAKRYNRKKHEEWPPEGWNPIWEQERPRTWGNYLIPDDVAAEKVYDHLKKIFDLKSAGLCHWQGCKPQSPGQGNPDYKMLKRHVETVHLGLKLVCKLCGVRKRADNRRKATHKRGCPERENEVATATKTAGAGKGKAGAGAAGETQPAEEDELMEDDMGSDLGTGEEGSIEDDEEIDQLEDYGSEEDQLEDDQQDEGQDQRMESEFESEDD
ncbi:hypothetical protein LXA43DRAFT_918772 [Ganoderma leucocontextum]|nr:hypothetical protein LXA43DRAFT_918772 [Ganoderma leucocontextum]